MNTEYRYIVGYVPIINGWIKSDEIVKCVATFKNEMDAITFIRSCYKNSRAYYIRDAFKENSRWNRIIIHDDKRVIKKLSLKPEAPIDPVSMSLGCLGRKVNEIIDYINQMEN